MRSETPFYEVRCAHCDVSFPIETRKCVHCGGPTVRRDQAESIMRSAYGAFDESSTAEAAEAAEGGEFGFQLPEFSSAEREIEMSDEPTSWGRSLIRGLGGFVWIIVLIGFTLARNCGEE